jgi:8-oxo-dGTP diphosphatase
MMKNYVVGFCFFGNEVILIEKIKPDWQKGSLNGPGGSIEEGESPAGAMVREFQEEVGHNIYDWQEFVTMKHTDWIVHFFVSHANSKLKLPGPTQTSKEEKIGWYYIYDLPYNVIFNLRWLIPLALYTDAKFPITLGMYK